VVIIKQQTVILNMSRGKNSTGKHSTGKHSTGKNSKGKKATDKKVVPSCPHCKNLGLKNDHWLRANSSHDSAIVCPVLLKTECRYCHQLGHSVSKCQRLADSKKEKTEKQETQEKQEKSFVASVYTDSSTTIHVELDKPSYASIAKQLLNVLHKKPYEPPSGWVPHGRLMDWTDDCDSSDDEDF
jgi:hypothetical protein